MFYVGWVKRVGLGGLGWLGYMCGLGYMCDGLCWEK